MDMRKGTTLLSVVRLGSLFLLTSLNVLMQAPKGSYGKCLLLTVEKTEGVLGEVLAIARGIP